MGRADTREFQEDKRFSERYYAHVVEIVSGYLASWTPGSPIQDTTQGTDLVLLRGVADAVETPVAVRVRRFDNYARHGGEFTLRSEPVDERTKLGARFYVYGWGHYATPRFAAWRLLDVPALRTAIASGLRPVTSRRNKDGVTGFVSYRFEPEFTLRSEDYTAPPQVPGPFDGLPRGCSVCGSLEWNLDSLMLVDSRWCHREACYSQDVPW